MRFKKSEWVGRLTKMEKAAFVKIENHVSKLNKENETILHDVIVAYKDYIKYIVKQTLKEVDKMYKHETLGGDDTISSIANGVKSDVIYRTNTLCSDLNNIISQQDDKLKKIKVSDISDLNKVKINHAFDSIHIKSFKSNPDNDIFSSNLKSGDVVHATDNNHSNYGTIISVKGNIASVKFINNEKGTSATVDISTSNLEKVDNKIYKKIINESKKSEDKIKSETKKIPAKTKKSKGKAKEAKTKTIEIVKKKAEIIKNSYKTEVASVILAIASYFVLYTILKHSNKVLSAANVINVIKEAKLQYSEGDSKKQIIIAVAAAGIISGLAVFGVSLVKKIIQK